MELVGRRYDTGRAVRLEIDGHRIARVASLEAADDCDWPWLAPGLVDLQVNGFGGQEFSSRGLDEEKAAAIVRGFSRFGVTRLCPTVTTEGHDVLRHALATLDAACRRWADVDRRTAGLHLEGPFITSEDGARGAHPKAHCRPPDWDEFQRLQEAAGGRIRLVTLSPEHEGAARFVAQAVASGVTVALGHMAASADQVRAAVDAGARLSTHLGNGSHPMLHRFRNYFWPQLADDRLMASLIVDGHHLPREVVKVFVRAKSPERCILVSDLSGQAGQPPGRYASPFCDVEILPDGTLVVAGQRELLAGAALPLHRGVVNVMRFAEVDLATALTMAVRRPAEALGIEAGVLEHGARADLIQFRLGRDDVGPNGFDLLATVVDGALAWGMPWRPSSTPSEERPRR